MNLTVHHWILFWTKWMQSTTGSYPESYDCSPPMDPTWSIWLQSTNWILKWMQSPVDSILNQMNAVHHWILSWTIQPQSTTESYPQPYHSSPPLDPFLNHMTPVHHCSLSWTIWRQSITGSYPDPCDYSPCTQPCFLKICFNTLLSTTHRFAMLSLTVRSLDYALPSLTFVPIPWPPHCTWLDH